MSRFVGANTTAVALKQRSQHDRSSPLSPPPADRATAPARPAEVAIVLQLFSFGWAAVHPNDTRYAKEVFHYDEGIQKVLCDLDRGEIPIQLVGQLVEASPRVLRNGCIVVEVHDYRSDALDLAASRKANGRLMPTVRRIQLRPTPCILLSQLRALCMEYRSLADRGWTEEETVGVERRILTRIREPLCLDPSVLVFCLASTVNYNKTKFPAMMERGIGRRVYGVRLCQERARRVIDPDADHAVSTKLVELSPLVSFLSRGKRRQPGLMYRASRRGARGHSDSENDTAMLEPPAVEGSRGADPAAALERAREIQFEPSADLGVRRSAFSENADKFCPGTYLRNTVETRHISDDDELWQVCFRGKDDEPFDSALSYFVPTKAAAASLCAELKHVCVQYEKRRVMFDLVEPATHLEAVVGDGADQPMQVDDGTELGSVAELVGGINGILDAAGAVLGPPTASMQAGTAMLASDLDDQLETTADLSTDLSTDLTIDEIVKSFAAP